jgi:tetratricopeptide (TPR) repeat protein
MRFLYVNAGREPFTTPLGRSVNLPAARTGLGDSIGWSRLLVDEGLVEQPFRLSTAQVLRGNIGDNHIAETDRHPRAALVHAMRANPDNPWFAHETGTWALGRRRFRYAARMAERALALEPENQSFIELHLRALVGSRRISRVDALTRVNDLVARAQRPDPSLSALAAELCVALGRIANALDLLSDALAIDPYNEDLHALKARALLAANRASEAVAAADAALALHPGGKELVALKAQILCALGQRDRALKLVREALRGRPSYRLRFLEALLALRLVWPRAPVRQGNGRFA